MKYQNKNVARILENIADILEAEKDNPYKIRAYRRAAETVAKMKEEIQDLVWKGDDISQFRYIGKGIAKIITEIIQNGNISALENRIRKNRSHTNLKFVKGLGKKRIKLLSEQKIYTKQDLLLAIQEERLSSIPGFSEKLQQKIFHSIHNPYIPEKFFKFKLAQVIIESFRQHILSLDNINQVTCANEYRRKKEIVGMVDFLVTANTPMVLDKLITLPEVEDVLARHEKYADIILRSGFRIHLRIIKPNQYGSSLLFFTGSVAHINHLQKLANNKNLIFNKEGLFKGKRRLKVSSEKQIYAKLGLKYIEAELREDRGEIEASANNTLPSLICESDIRGDLHCHTSETDGTATLEEMVIAAKERGYEYLAITDHTKHLTITNGLDEKRLLRQIDLIDELNNRIQNFTILKSSEVDILEDGSLDLPDWILKKLDLRVCSLHSKFKLSENKQTERIIRAMDNPYFNILGHPTGRIINYRDPYPLNMKRILEAAKERGCIMELNAQPARLDLNDTFCLMAKQLGVKIAISSDAHSINGFNFIRFGIAQARRGWLESEDVINTRTLQDLRKILNR